MACLGDSDCPLGKPICSPTTKSCVACNTEGIAANACKTRDAAFPFCAANGPLQGQCGACATSADCSNPSQPICSPTSNTCVACNISGLASNVCQVKNAALPGCSSLGATAGQCVECTESSQCGVSTLPICNVQEQRCRSCVQDAECVAKGGDLPGVCMSHEDGRCASEAETAYAGYWTDVKCASTGGGSKSLPACSLSELIPRLPPETKLVVVKELSDGFNFTGSKPLSIVGKKAGQKRPVLLDLNPLYSGYAVRVGSASLYLRDIHLNGSRVVSRGVVVADAAIIQMDRVRISTFNGEALTVFGGYRITNSIIDNSGVDADQNAIVLSGSPDLPHVFAYNTVANNQWYGVACSRVQPDEKYNLITLNKGTLISPEDQAFNCSFPKSLVGGNPYFMNNPDSPFRLSGISPCVDFAKDPSPLLSDFDGDPRPANKSDCGADEFIP